MVKLWVGLGVGKGLSIGSFKYFNMLEKTIKIPREIAMELKRFGDGKSYNKSLRLLLDGVECDGVDKSSVEFSNIRLDLDLFEKLGSCRAYPQESYGAIIYRLLQNQKK